MLPFRFYRAVSFARVRSWLFLAGAVAVFGVASCSTTGSQARVSTTGSVSGPTIKTFLPWNQNRKNLGRYDLGWQASPKRHPGNGLSLAEILWAYTYPSKDWARYPGMEEFYLKQSSRKTEDGKQVDLKVTDPRFADYISDVAVRQVKRFGVDGVMLDGWVYEARREIPRAQQDAARVRIARAIRQKLGDKAVIMGNVNWRTDTSTHPYLSGVYMELLKDANRRYTASEIREMERLMIMHDRALQPPYIVAVEAWRINKGNPRRNAAENEKYARLFAAMTSVVPRNGYFIYADNNSDSPNHDHDHVYYDFYDIDLGQPTSAAVSINDGVKYRNFSDGVIIYNRTRRPAEVKIPGYAAVTIEGETGLFCHAERSRLDCSL